MPGLHGETMSFREDQNIDLLNRKWQDIIMCQFVRKTPVQIEPNNGATIVIVTYNSAATIAPCIQSLHRTLRANDEVVIVDNASRDETASVVLSQISSTPRFTLISNPVNCGYASAADQGAKAGCNPYIVFLNPDTLVGDHWIERLQYHLGPHKTAAVGPVSNYVAGLQKAELYLPKEFCDCNDLDSLNQKLRKKYHQQGLETKVLIGFCLMVKRKVYERIGGMDHNLFLGNDDLDLSWRITKAGYRLAVAKDCAVFHKGQVSFASEAKNNTDRLVQESTDYLFYKLTRHYGPNRVPSSQGLWGIDWFRPVCEFGENQPLTSMVILTFNQLEFTRQCVESVFRHTKTPFELIMVDNGSTDRTLAYINTLDRSKTCCIRIKVISNAENVGFAKGCNQGISEARGEYILLLNNDVVVTFGWLSRLMHAIEKRPQIDLVGPMTNYVSGPQLVENPAYDVATADGLERYAAVHASQYGAEIESNWRLAGFCMLINRSVIEKIGGLDDRFRIGNFEDDDFCLRAHLAGFHAAIAKDCYVHHYGSQTFLGNQIDFDERLNSNWNLFKQKWNIPVERPYHTKYQVPLPKGGFEKGKHYIAIQNDTLEPDYTSTMRQHALKQSDSLSGCGTKPSDSILLIPPQSMHPPGGIQMSILDQVLDAVRHNVAPHDKSSAIWILQRIIEADPQNGTAHNEIGLLFYEQNELAKAQSHLHQAVRFCTDNPEYFINLGDFYHVVHQDAHRAIQMYSQAVELKADDGATLLKIAHLYTSERDFEKARCHYQRLLEIDPNQAEAKQCLNQIDEQFKPNEDPHSIDQIYSRVLSQINEGDREAAMAGLSLILSKKPDHALAHNDFGVLAYEQNNKDEALLHYQRAVTLEPENSVFLKNLADFHWSEQGDPKTALELYVRVLKTTADDMEAILNCGRICMAMHKKADAGFFFKRALEIEPGNEMVRGLIRRLEDKHDDTATLDDRKALYSNAQEKAAAGDLHGAIEDLTKLVSVYRNDANTFNDLGVLHHEAGNIEKALACYREAVQLSPENETFQKNLADFYLMQQGRIEDAMRIYLRVLERNPQDIDSLLATGLVCIQMNKIEDARDFFKRVIDIEPWNPHAQQGLAKLDKVPYNGLDESRSNPIEDLEQQKAFG